MRNVIFMVFTFKIYYFYFISSLVNVITGYLTVLLSFTIHPHKICLIINRVLREDDKSSFVKFGDCVGHVVGLAFLSIYL